MANALEPGAVKKVNKGTMAFKQMENISFFLEFAGKYIPKTELFQTVDLYEGQDPNAVLICLASLARKSEKLFGKKGLGPKVSFNHHSSKCHFYDAEHISQDFCPVLCILGSNISKKSLSPIGLL